MNDEVAETRGPGQALEVDFVDPRVEVSHRVTMSASQEGEDNARIVLSVRTWFAAPRDDRVGDAGEPAITAPLSSTRLRVAVRSDRERRRCSHDARSRRRRPPEWRLCRCREE